jgi:hypothetical protein
MSPSGYTDSNEIKNISTDDAFPKSVSLIKKQQQQAFNVISEEILDATET